MNGKLLITRSLIYSCFHGAFMSTNVIAGGSNIPFKILVDGLSEFHFGTKSGEQVGPVGLAVALFMRSFPGRDSWTEICEVFG